MQYKLVNHEDFIQVVTELWVKARRKRGTNILFWKSKAKSQRLRAKFSQCSCKKLSSNQCYSNTQTNPLTQQNEDNRVETGQTIILNPTRPNSVMHFSLFCCFHIFFFGFVFFFSPPFFYKGFGHGNTYQTSFFKPFSNHFKTKQGISHMNKSTRIPSPMNQIEPPKDLNTLR